jgi:hypothetical protein
MGQHKNVPFTGDVFAPDYAGIMETISQVQVHPYHGLKFHEVKKQWACTGMSAMHFLLYPCTLLTLIFNSTHSYVDGQALARNDFGAILD